MVVTMDTELIFKIIGIGLIVSIAYQVLVKVGRDEQATLVSVTGVIIIMIVLVREMYNLFDTVKRLFGL